MMAICQIDIIFRQRMEVYFKGGHFDLDFGNRMSLEESENSFSSATSTSSPVQVLDQDIFDLEDF